MANIDELRSEIERLTRELDLQNSEIINSAKYGLGLLEEKQSLQSKCEELENLYENTKHELEITQEVMIYAINISHPPTHHCILPSFHIPIHHTSRTSRTSSFDF